MFNFLGKAISYYGRHNIAATRDHHKLRFLQHSPLSMLFSRNCISKSNNANHHSFTVSYLMNSCGLSLESALSASKYVRLKTPHKPDSVLNFFKKRGFPKSHTTNIIKRIPKVLLLSPEKTLLPKLEFFHSKGISNPDIVKILSKYPGLFCRSLDNHLIPTFNSLSHLLQSSEKTIALIIQFPHILYHDADYYLLPNVKILQDSGVPESDIIKSIASWPQLFLMHPKIFEKSAASVKEMGINPLRLKFVLAIQAKCIMSESQWESKLHVYKKWGWSEQEWLAAFLKCPWCMITSEDKITAIMDFFVNGMGWEPAVIAKHPVLTTFSMEKRIIPRGAVIQFLLSKGLVKSDTTYLITLLSYPEKTFMLRLMNYDDAPKLLKLYQEKLDHSNKTKCSV